MSRVFLNGFPPVLKAFLIAGGDSALSSNAEDKELNRAFHIDESQGRHFSTEFRWLPRIVVHGCNWKNGRIEHCLTIRASARGG